LPKFFRKNIEKTLDIFPFLRYTDEADFGGAEIHLTNMAA